MPSKRTALKDGDVLVAQSTGLTPKNASRQGYVAVNLARTGASLGAHAGVTGVAHRSTSGGCPATNLTAGVHATVLLKYGANAVVMRLFLFPKFHESRLQLLACRV